MKRALLILATVLVCLSACQHRKDPLVAQVYQYRLYKSELDNIMPTGLSTEDSLALVNHYIDNWIKERLVLHEAKKRLSVRERNFDKQLEEYRNNLIVNAYYDKLVSQSDWLNISDKELEEYTKMFDKRYAVDKEIVRLNYVKLQKNSKLIEPVRRILFDENLRADGKAELEQMLGDSVEYMLDDNTWLYLADIQNEVNFSVQPDVQSAHQQVDQTAGDYQYLIVILDYKDKRSANETEEENAAARMMLLNQRRSEIISEHIDKLYRKAQKEGIIMQ